MKIIILVAIIGTGLCFIVGCINNIDKIHTMIIANYPSEFEYIQFEKGKEIKRFVIKKDDKIYDDLLLWIITKKNGWKSDFNSYAPQQLFFSKKININIINNLVIININVNKEKWVQISREFTNNDWPITISNSK